MRNIVFHPQQLQQQLLNMYVNYLKKNENCFVKDQDGLSSSTATTISILNRYVNLYLN